MKYYKISLNNKTEIVSGDDEAMKVAGEMVKKFGGGVPKIIPCDEHGNELKVEVNCLPPKMPEKSEPKKPEESQSFSTWTNTIVDRDAEQRIKDMHAAIEANGGPKIDESKQFFATGTRMATEGYAVQTAREKAHNKNMLLGDAIEQLINTVDREFRADHKMSAKDIADNLDADFDDGQLYVKDHTLNEHALRGIVARLDSPALGYILGLQDRIKLTPAKDRNQSNYRKDIERLVETLRHECLRFADTEFKLRMREFPEPNIYAALSPGFGVADAPMVMEQILQEMPKDAKGSWSYDPDTTRWELRASIWTPVPVAKQAVGEPFEGFVDLHSFDNGTGSFVGGGGINIIRCLNASINTAGEAMRRIHRGSKILYDIKTMLAKALKAIDALCVAWGKARNNEVEMPTGVPIEQAIPGFWRSLLKEGELQGVLTGRKEHHVTGLTQAYFNERRDPDRVVLADFGQGWTKYIQSQPSEIRHKAEEAIGSWMIKPSKMRCDLKE